MITNQTAWIIIGFCILYGGFHLFRGNTGHTIAAIVVGAICGISIFFHFIAGQPIW